jgi:hypothetical protein
MALLELQNRNILVDVIPRLYGQARANFENLVKKIGQAAVLAQMPGGASFADAAVFIVDAGDQVGWVKQLVAELLVAFPGRAELETVRDQLDRDAVKPTTKEPFDEVLLEANRPFVNRRPLRNALLRLVSVNDETVLLVDGAPQTGKSFSYYLINYAASRRGLSAHRFEVKKTPVLRDLAEEIMRRLGAAIALAEQGTESAERWADKLAAELAELVRQSSGRRVFVFDEFPTSPPPETLSLIVRLARYADEELRTKLRVALVKFPGELPPELDDVALRDEAMPFSVSDMVDAVMQIAKARGWSVKPETIKTKLDEFEAAKARTLRERFRFLRDTILRDLAQAGNAVAMPGDPE